MESIPRLVRSLVKSIFEPGIDMTEIAFALDGIRRMLQDFYGKRLRGTADLATSACCSSSTASRFRDVLRLIPEEVKQRQYGCGSPIPADDLTGLTVLDLGSGAGIDAFIAAKLVGPHGRVIGLDMTEEQLQVARRNAPSVAERFGLSNVEFARDYIETAESIPDQSVDLAISNCVINLSPRKDLVFRTIHRILKEGGEFYVSDIVCDRRLPESIRQNERLYGECLAGAEYFQDLHDVMEGAGFRDVRVVEKTILDAAVGVEAAKFCSVTLRGFKLALDRRCEDYGQIAVYRGNCQASPVAFELDEAHLFEASRPTPVCRNTAWMLSRTRLRRYFEVGPEIKHFGRFDCAPRTDRAESDSASGCCS